MFATNNNNAGTDEGNKPLSRDNLIQAAEDIQVSILNLLSSQYGKAFDPNYNPGLFSGRFNHYKRPIAKLISKYCAAKVSELSQVAFFLSECNNNIHTNNEKDPVGRLDKIRKKPHGGKLGEVLNTFSPQLLDLNRQFGSYLRQEQGVIKLHLEVLHHGLAVIEEKNFGEHLMKPDKPPLIEYHVIKLENLCKDPAYAPIFQEIKDILSYASNPFSKEIEATFENSIKQTMLEQRKKRLELDIIELIKDAQILQLAPQDRIRYVIIRELVRHFTETLKMQERELFWHWYLHALKGNLNKKFTSKKFGIALSSGELLVKKSREYYMRGQGQEFSTITDLLENKRLADLFLNIINESNCVHEDLVDTFSKAINNHVSNLGELGAIETSKKWSIIFDFGAETDWHHRLNALADNMLYKPLSQMQQALQSNHLVTYVSDSDCSALIQHAEGVLQQIAVLEAIKQADQVQAAQVTDPSTVQDEQKPSPVTPY